MSKVVQDEITGCWEWQGRLNKDGYGLFDFKGKAQRAHRFSLEYLGKGLSKDNYSLHKCDNRCCVNPDHLYEGTQQDNMRDMVERGRSYKGTNNNRKQCKCMVYGIVYESITEAANCRQVPISRVHKFLNQEDNKDYIYL